MGFLRIHDYKSNIFFSDEDPIWDVIGYYLGTACANVIFTMSA